jgi:guanylate kinase
VFDVDWQGGRALRAHWPGDAVTIFILPPDLGTLESRLRQRATDADEVIRRRLAMAIEELGHHTEYQHRVANDELDRAYGILRAIYLCRRDGRARHPELAPLVDESEGARPRALADQLIAAARDRRVAPAD